MGWHLSGVTRTRIRVVGVNFGEFLSQRGIRVSEFQLTAE